MRSGMIIHDIAGSTHKAGPVPVLRDARATPREQCADVSRFWFANPVQRDCDDGCSPEPLVVDGSVFFAVGDVLPWGP